MKINKECGIIINDISESKSAVFSELVRIAGLNPEADFIEARLQWVDFEGSDLSNFDLREADLRGAK